MGNDGRFKTGDVVVLKSGGPPITVDHYAPGGDKMVLCKWIDKSGTPQKEPYNEAALKLVETDDDTPPFMVG